MNDPAKPTEPAPDGDEAAAAVFNGAALTLIGGVLLAVPLYSLFGLAWAVASGAFHLPLDRGAVRDAIMAIVIGFFGVFMLRIGLQTLRRELLRRRSASMTAPRP